MLAWRGGDREQQCRAGTAVVPPGPRAGPGMDPPEQPDLRRVDRDRRVHGAAVPHGAVARPYGQDLRRRLRGGHPAAGRPGDGQPPGGLPPPRGELMLVTIAQVVGQLCAVVGLVAGFWHIFWVAGVAVGVTGLLAVGVHSAGYMRLEHGQGPPP